MGEELVGDTRQLTVLQSFRPLSATSNPYLAQLVGSMPNSIEIVPFSWRFALLGRYDVFHVQWPELLLRGSDRRRTALRHMMFAVLLPLIVVRRIAVVRTVHNLDPHDTGSRFEKFLLHRLDRRTTAWITLTEHTPVPAGRFRRTIVHGHYRQWFVDQPRRPMVPGRFLYFGLIRAYKGVDTLVPAFARMPDADVTLRIVGKPDPAALGDAIADSSRSDARISTRFSYVSDADLAMEVAGAELVVLPYTDIHNSGSLLLALSLDRPVLVPESKTTSALREEVGGDWVLLFRPPLTAAILQDALTRTRDGRGDQTPDLSRRDWSTMGEQFATLYREASDLVRRPRRYSE